MAKVAFIGLGIMGSPMAGHLLAAGHELTVHTRTAGRAAALLDRGARWAGSAAEAGRGAEVVFVCVTDTPDVRQVVEGERGLLSAPAAGRVIVDHSTISPTVTRELADRTNRAGMHLLDAPVSGGDVGARNGTLSIMVGGDAGALERVRPVMAAYGKSIVHCGGSGAGQLTKLTNQIVVSLTNLAVCEGLRFAAAQGLDVLRTIEAISGGAAASWQLSNLGPRMARGDFAPGFMVKLQNKDLRLVREAIEEKGMRLAGLDLVMEDFARLAREGRGEDGTQALYDAVASRAGNG